MSSSDRRGFLRRSAFLGGALALGGPPELLGALSGMPRGASASGSPDEPTSHPLRILILGGTGFIGPHQVSYARRRGHVLTLFNRGRTAPDLFPGVETLIGDRNGDLSALRGREWDAVIDNSGFYPRWVRLTAELLEGSVERYLFVSSISAYGPELAVGDDEFTAPRATMEDPTDESEPPYGPSYGARKALCEDELVKVFGEKRSIVVRPGLITGPGDPTDRINYWLRRVGRGGEVLVPGRPEDPVQLIDARDLTGWMIRLLEGGESGPYNGVGPESRLGMDGFVHGVRAVYAAPVSFTWVPEGFLAERELLGRYTFPWTPEAFRAFSRISNERALATGLTYSPLARTLLDMRGELEGAGPDGIEPTLGSELGLPPEEEAEVLSAWHRTRG